MTVKELFPQLTHRHRTWIGYALVASFKSVRGVAPNKVMENGQMVCDYPEDFREYIGRIYKRFVKKVGEIQPPKQKRPRLKAVRISRKR